MEGKEDVIICSLLPSLIVFAKSLKRAFLVKTKSRSDFAHGLTQQEYTGPASEFKMITSSRKQENTI